jgi:hypothetical protein
MAAGVTGLDFLYTPEPLENGFHAPETTGG